MYIGATVHHAVELNVHGVYNERIQVICVLRVRFREKTDKKLKKN
jgi:hypothetical protein